MSAWSGLSDGFWVVLVVYGILFALFFLAPVLTRVHGRSPRRDLRRLVRDVGHELSEGFDRFTGLAERAREDVARAESELAQLSASAAELEAEGALAELGRYRNHLLPEMERRLDRLRSEAGRAAEAQSQGVSRWLDELPALHGTFANPLVKDVACSLAALFPRGNFRQFAPASVAFVGEIEDRLALTRRMTGVFVLLGLLGTMIKLNVVVSDIGGMSDDPAMDSQTFLSQMGLLMDGIGGAFDYSIYGILLMVGSLVLLGITSRIWHGRLAEVERTVSGEVVPLLARINDTHRPELSLTDLVERTGTQISTLNESVAGLSSGLQVSLTGLDEQIGATLEQFGSFQNHYKRMDELVQSLELAANRLGVSAESMTDVGRGLQEGADVLASPIQELNSVLAGYLEAEARKKDREYLKELVGEVARTHAATWAVAEREIERNQQALATFAAAQDEQAKRFVRQWRATRRSLESMGETLRATTPVELANAMKTLGETTDRVSQQMVRSGRSFERAASVADRLFAVPTLFAWVRLHLIPGVRGWLSRR